MGCSIATNGSCKRDLQVPELVDDWDWVQTVGGWGGTSTPESTSTTASLSIGSDCVATLFVNGGLVGQAVFDMRVGVDTLLLLSNGSLWGRKYLVVSAADRLLLADRCDHCDYHYFERSG